MIRLNENAYVICTLIWKQFHSVGDMCSVTERGIVEGFLY